MKTLHFSQEEISSIFQTLAIILHLGNIEFSLKGDTASSVKFYSIFLIFSLFISLI